MVVPVGKFQKYYKKDIVRRFLSDKAIDALDKAYVDNRNNGHNDIVTTYYLGDRLAKMYGSVEMENFHKKYLENKVRRITPRKDVKTKSRVNKNTHYKIYFVDPGVSKDWFNITLFGVTIVRF